ncbi:hypothetical protein [Alteribacter natronophilus]|uniref:hypothetical protein n=1 Tax=Alteribacter natronophilus TaxID=2583810 RepID=UPI00110F5380|nr:hypothetical protein [Alteribacter natronophilus]TMW71165.1 hypothetical protein FGB90_14480 [Alteribacter natronophilus]
MYEKQLSEAIGLIDFGKNAGGPTWFHNNDKAPLVFEHYLQIGLLSQVAIWADNHLTVEDYNKYKRWNEEQLNNLVFEDPKELVNLITETFLESLEQEKEIYTLEARLKREYYFLAQWIVNNTGYFIGVSEREIEKSRKALKHIAQVSENTVVFEQAISTAIYNLFSPFHKSSHNLNTKENSARPNVKQEGGYRDKAWVKGAVWVGGFGGAYILFSILISLISGN